ncbi:MAG: GIY-YIG nuclease family protein [Chloroflexota bacterium]
MTQAGDPSSDPVTRQLKELTDKVADAHRMMSEIYDRIAGGIYIYGLYDPRDDLHIAYIGRAVNPEERYRKHRQGSSGTSDTLLAWFAVLEHKYLVAELKTIKRVET